MNIEVTDEVNSLLISVSLEESKAALNALGASVWNFVGAYGIGNSYAVGDVVTYEGETWYRINANGGNLGDTPVEGTFWTILAQAGADGGGADAGATLIDPTTAYELTAPIAGTFRGQRIKYHIKPSPDTCNLTINASIAIPSDSGITFPKQLESDNTYIVALEWIGTKWMLTTVIGGGI